jgi:hypothetical protein
MLDPENEFPEIEMDGFDEGELNAPLDRKVTLD